MSGTLEERFWPKVNKTDTCWLWTASRDRYGYGKFGFAGRTVKAHRLAYELLVGPIPAGLTLDHLCRVRHCVNPAHMEPVTNRENVLRGDTIPAKHAAKTHCPLGHALEGENLIPHHLRRGRRDCRTCQNARQRTPEYRAQHRMYMRAWRQRAWHDSC